MPRASWNGFLSQPELLVCLSFYIFEMQPEKGALPGALRALAIAAVQEQSSAVSDCAGAHADRHFGLGLAVRAGE